jgi:formate hydrogenlyase subunit 3/multisubunit Na+/H+ antiporter MnhD subunit
MSHALYVVAIVLPLAVAAAICIRPRSSVALAIAPWATLPAFVVAFGDAAVFTIDSKTILLGTSIGVDDVVTRAFLVLTASVWLASGLFARSYMAGDPHRARFWIFFLITAAGNIGLVLAEDVASFYTFFSLMTFAAYGLVAHVQTGESRRAARIYLVMALVGEMLLLAAFVLVVGVDVNLPLGEVPRVVALSSDRDLVVGLLLAGFGVKLGALVLHIWLPLAHPVAPTPASAVLSGAMIKAGVLGLLRFLPLGVVAMPDAGLVCLVAGFGAAFYAVVVGLFQQNAKTILAYSSVSQMGFVTVVFGVALSEPRFAPMAVAAILFYSLHHALVKAALFLGTGVASAARPGWPRYVFIAGLSFAALDLAGAPLSSGALAKISLKYVLAEDYAGLVALLSVGAIGSTLLMAKLLVIVFRRPERVTPRPGLWAPWLLLLVLDIALLASPPIERERLELLVAPTTVASAAWPIIVGIVLALVAYLVLRRRPPRPSPLIPAGDLVVIFERAYGALERMFANVVLATSRVEARLKAWASRHTMAEHRWGALVRTTSQIERSLWTFATIGAALLLFGILLAGALAR